MPVLLRARSWGAHLLMVAAVAAAIALGLWQLHVWEAARTAEARDVSNAKPVELTAVMSGDDPFPGQYLGQPVRLSGEWLPKGTLYVADRALDGRRGYWVTTPVLVGKSAMPVVRGWSATPDAPEPNGQVSVTGWLQPSEGTGAVDDDAHDDVIPEMRVASMVEHVDADLYSGFVVARTTPSEGRRDPGHGVRRTGGRDPRLDPRGLQPDLAAQPALRHPVVDLRGDGDLHLGALVP